MFKLTIYMCAIATFIACGTGPAKEGIKTLETQSENSVCLTKEQIEIADITFDSARYIPMSNILTVRGRVVLPPQHTYTVHLPYGGFIRIGELLPGTPVVQGQIIAWVRNPIFITMQQSYLESKIKVQQLELSYKREESLVENKINPQKNLEQIRAELEMNRVALASYEKQLELVGIDKSNLKSNNLQLEVPIRSPFTGYVQELSASNGNFIKDQQPLMVLNRLDGLKLELQVFEQDLSRLAIGQTVSYKLVSDINWEESRKAKISLISTAIGIDGVAKVYANVMNEDKELRSGQFIDAQIHGNTKASVAIPEAAVLSYQGKKLAFYTNSTNLSSGVTFKMIELSKAEKNGDWAAVSFTDQAFDAKGVVWVNKGARTLLSALNQVEE